MSANHAAQPTWDKTPPPPPLPPACVSQLQIYRLCVALGTGTWDGGPQRSVKFLLDSESLESVSSDYSFYLFNLIVIFHLVCRHSLHF